MKILELFAGTRSIGRAFEKRGHDVYSVEWDKKFPDIDLYADIAGLTADDILQNSVGRMLSGHHRTAPRFPSRLLATIAGKIRKLETWTLLATTLNFAIP